MTSKHDIIKFRRGTAAEWAASQPQPGGEVLKLGEPGYEKDTGKLKIGDGVTPWNSLDYVAAGIIVVEDVDHLINDVLQAGSGIALNFDDNNDSLTISASGLINNPSNNRILTSRDNTTTGIDAESNFTFDGGGRAIIQCVCPSGSSGFTVIGDQRATLIRQTCYGNPEEIITDDGTTINRPINRQIFFSARGSSSSPSGLIVDDSIFVLRGDAHNHYGTLNTNGNLDHRTIRIRGYVSNSGTFYDGSSLSFETSSGGNTAYDNLMTFDHNGILSVNNAITVNNLKLDGNTLSSTNNNGNIIIQPSGTGALQRDGGGNARGQYAVDWQTVRSTGTMVAAGSFSVIGGGYFNTNTGDGSTICGGSFNTIAMSVIHSTIGGGSINTISGYCNTIGGGKGNTSSNLYSTVGGGVNNTTSNDYSTVGGGVLNTSAGIGSTVAGGGWYNSNTYQFEGNTATGNISTVGGGALNIASEAGSTVCGGIGNTSNGYYSTVGGGISNTSSGYASVVGGGRLNSSGSNYCCTVSGGRQNTSSGYASTVGGGRQNTSSNNYSTVGGGIYNDSTGYASAIPGGYSAKAARYGELSHAAGMFSNYGDAQHTILVARTSTIDATANQILYLGSADILTIPAETTWAFTIKLSAYNDTDNEGGWWIFRGGIRRNATNGTALIGSLVTESGTESSLSTASASVVADDTNEALEIRVTGVASKNIRWVAVVDISQVSYGTP